ncbi:hypothetical protein BSLG_005858 [Batrachochytrium salamandrivorans]|nr:hypothetical protein BSLG_005858 [Batrachochytrium salamandrivorans]
MENKVFYIQYLDNQSVRIDTHINNERTALQSFPLDSVGDLVVAIKQTLSSKLGAIDLTSSPSILWWMVQPFGNTLLTSIQEPVGSYDHPLIIKLKGDSGQSLVNRLTVDDNGALLKRIKRVRFSKNGRVNLSDLRPPEVKQLIRAIFQIDKISSICVLNFWTVFGGDPYLYQLFAKDMLAQLDNDTRSKIALGEKFHRIYYIKCIDEARTALWERGISADLLNAIPTTGVSKMAIQQDLQKMFLNW